MVRLPMFSYLTFWLVLSEDLERCGGASLHTVTAVHGEEFHHISSFSVLMGRSRSHGCFMNKMHLHFSIQLRLGLITSSADACFLKLEVTNYNLTSSCSYSSTFLSYFSIAYFTHSSSSRSSFCTVLQIDVYIALLTSTSNT